jgi:mannose-6-phosphate isomerase-like protein (cupin superfamily)
MPSIIDLKAEAEKLTMLHMLTPTTRRTGYRPQLPRYRDGLLLVGKSSGTSHWETHPEDELVWIVEGTATLDVVQADGLRSFALGGGMVAIVPPGVWHRFRSTEGKTTVSTVLPGDHIDLDVDDPRTSVPDLDLGDPSRPPSIVNLDAEIAKLTMFRGRTPQTTFAARQGSAALLAPYRDGFLMASRYAGTTHWETHDAEELVYVVDGTETLDIIEDDRPQSHTLGPGMVTIVPPGTWHRFRSAEGVTSFSLTVPGRHIDLDVEDPRRVEAA